MNIATMIRFDKGTYETIWANDGWRPHALIVELARRYGVGMSVIAADSTPEDIERMCAACDGLIIPGNKYNIEMIMQSLIQEYEKLKGTPLQGMLAFAG